MPRVRVPAAWTNTAFTDLGVKANVAVMVFQIWDEAGLAANGLPGPHSSGCPYKMFRDAAVKQACVLCHYGNLTPKAVLTTQSLCPVHQFGSRRRLVIEPQKKINQTALLRMPEPIFSPG